MPKLPKASITKLIEGPPRNPGTPNPFFESFRLNYGSYQQAGRKLGISPNVLEELTHAKRKYEPSDARLEQVQKAISRMSRGEYNAAKKYARDAGTMTPAQLEYAKRYAAKSVTGQRYFRKAILEAFKKKYDRVRMPALGAGGKITNSPKMQKKTRGNRRAIRRRGR